MRWPRARAGWVLVVLTLLVTAQLQIWTTSPPASTRLVEALLATAFTLPLLVRGRPLVVLLVVVTASFGSLLLGSDLGQPWFATLLAVYALGALAGTAAAVAGMCLVSGMVLAIDLPRLQAGTPIEDVLPGWFIIGFVFGFGRWMSARRREQARLAARVEAAERERERATQEAVAQERAVIARELHDLVGHSLAVMVLQAQAAERVLETDAAQAGKVLDLIADLGREGLDELRRLLGVLVAPANDELPALPTLGNLDSLVSRFRAAGLPVELTVHGDRRALPAGLDLSAYRIVQEALTNTLKHAGPTRAAVDIRFERDLLAVTVADEGSPPRHAPEARVGRGLIGMRERVALYGGELAAGRRPTGGFEIVARFPLGAAT